MKRYLSPAVLVLVVLLACPAAVLALNPNHQCSYCHNVHALIPPENLGENLCLSCHGPAGISILKADVHTNKTNSKHPPFRVTCSGCHDSHDNRLNWLGGRNLKLVGSREDATGLARIATPGSGIRDVVFESRGSDAGGATLHSFADADQDANGVYDGVCEVCHTRTKFHRNDGSAGTAHNTGRSCVNCHAHVDRFNRR